MAHNVSIRAESEAPRAESEVDDDNITHLHWLLRTVQLSSAQCTNYHILKEKKFPL